MKFKKIILTTPKKPLKLHCKTETHVHQEWYLGVGTTIKILSARA